jgi:acyl-CoA thioesterase FadM
MYSVPHQFEASVRWNETDDLVHFEATVPYTWMKGAVFNNFRILESQEQIGNSTEVGLSLNTA